MRFEFAQWCEDELSSHLLLASASGLFECVRHPVRHKTLAAELPTGSVRDESATFGELFAGWTTESTITAPETFA